MFLLSLPNNVTHGTLATLRVSCKADVVVCSPPPFLLSFSSLSVPPNTNSQPIRIRQILTLYVIYGHVFSLQADRKKSTMKARRLRRKVIIEIWHVFLIAIIRFQSHSIYQCKVYRRYWQAPKDGKITPCFNTTGHDKSTPAWVLSVVSSALLLPA